MTRIALLALAAAVLGASARAGEAGRDKGADAKLYAHARWPFPGFPGPGNERVLRSAAELAAAAPRKEGESAAEAEARAAADVARALKVKGIDWKRQMLVLIHVRRAHPLYPVVVTGLKADAKALTVHYTFYAPVAARPQDRPPRPVAVSLMALVSRFDGKVRCQGNPHYPR